MLNFIVTMFAVCFGTLMAMALCIFLILYVPFLKWYHKIYTEKMNEIYESDYDENLFNF